jgi:hypothetical protein
LEEDVQWVFIQALRIEDGKLVVVGEDAQTYLVDLKLRIVTKADVKVSVIPIWSAVAQRGTSIATAFRRPT